LNLNRTPSPSNQVLNGDPELSQTKLRDFIAAINNGQVNFENGSIFDGAGGLFEPSSAEDAVSQRWARDMTRPFQR
jgi:hypothetical protein